MNFLKHFFSTEANPKLQLFTLPHLIPIILIIISIILIARNKEFFRNWKYEKHFRYTLAISLFLCDMSILIWRLSTHTFSIKYSLPLHLCTFSIYASIFMLLKINKKVFDYIFYFAMAGALMALLSPDLRFSYTQFRYYEFMIAHGLILVSIMYMLFVYDFIPRFDAVIKSFLVVQVLGILLIPFNTLTGGTYMMIVNKTPNAVLDKFGPWPYYVIGLEILLILLFLISYLIIYIFIFRNKENIN